MNITQKFLATIAFAASAMVASAGTLYWQVEGENEGDTFTSATLYASTDRGGSSASATSLGTVSESSGVLITDESGTWMSDPMQTDVSAYSGSDPAYYFFVEMANYTSGGVNQGTKRGYAYSYQELVSAGYIATNPFDSPSQVAAASVANMGASTPEPTSGMLLLIGGSLLALRRRRR